MRHVMQTLTFQLPSILARNPTALITNIEQRVPDPTKIQSIRLRPNGKGVEVSIRYKVTDR